MLKNSRAKISNLAKNTPKFFYEIFIFKKQYFCLLKLVKELAKMKYLLPENVLLLRTTCWSYQNMLKVIRHPPRFSLDPLKGLQGLQNHQLSSLITILSTLILEHEGIGGIFLKKGKIREKTGQKLIKNI